MVGEGLAENKEENIDKILELANELDIGFNQAERLFMAGFKEPSQCAKLSVEKLMDITGLSENSAQHLLARFNQVKDSEVKVEVSLDEEIEAETKTTTKSQESLKSSKKTIPGSQKTITNSASTFDVPKLKSKPVKLSETGKIEYGKFYRLNPDMIKVWVITGPWVVIIIPLVMMLLFAFLLPILFLVFLIIFVIAFVLSKYWADLTYENYSFAFTKELVIVRTGIIYKNETHIPYGRIQNINTHQGIIDRIYDVWHLSISATGATSMIHGVPQHEAVKAFILDNVEAVKAKRAPKVDVDQGYREVYLALKEISRTLEGKQSRAIVTHK